MFVLVVGVMSFFRPLISGTEYCIRSLQPRRRQIQLSKIILQDGTLIGYYTYTENNKCMMRDIKKRPFVEFTNSSILIIYVIHNTEH